MMIRAQSLFKSSIHAVQLQSFYQAYTCPSRSIKTRIAKITYRSNSVLIIKHNRRGGYNQ